MNLLVDLGNSRLKWAWQTAGPLTVQAVGIRDREPAAVLAEAWRELARPTRVLVASVGGAAWRAAIGDWARSRWSIGCEFAQSRAEQLGVRNGYREPASLGVDRWMALIAARTLTPGPVCVVDCGSAVTVDALAANGEFLGGAIFPGLQLLRESLARGTEAIALTRGEASSCTACATADGVTAGTLYGLAGAIERVVSEQERSAGPMSLLLTGGDAPALQPLLRRAARLVPDLVLQGLACIAAEGGAVS